MIWKVIENEMKFKYKDDDGLATRPWIELGEERCDTGCDRVMEILKDRPWVIGEVVEVEKNCEDDMHGIDLYVSIDNRLLERLGIKKMPKGVPFQIKSSAKMCVEFVHSHDVFKRGIYKFKDDIYTFVLNGTDAVEMIEADIVGQIVNLAKVKMGIPEEDILFFLSEEMHDCDLVEKYIDHKIILKETAWYRRSES